MRRDSNVGGQVAVAAVWARETSEQRPEPEVGLEGCREVRVHHGLETLKSDMILTDYLSGMGSVALAQALRRGRQRGDQASKGGRVQLRTGANLTDEYMVQIGRFGRMGADPAAVAGQFRPRRPKSPGSASNIGFHPVGRPSLPSARGQRAVLVRSASSRSVKVGGAGPRG